MDANYRNLNSKHYLRQWTGNASIIDAPPGSTTKDIVRAELVAFLRYSDVLNSNGATDNPWRRLNRNKAIVSPL